MSCLLHILCVFPVKPLSERYSSISYGLSLWVTPIVSHSFYSFPKLWFRHLAESVVLMGIQFLSSFEFFHYFHYFCYVFSKNNNKLRDEQRVGYSPINFKFRNTQCFESWIWKSIELLINFTQIFLIPVHWYYYGIPEWKMR